MASVLLATSGLHIYYSQEARMYAMSAFLVAGAVYAFLKTLKNNSTLFFALFSILLVLNFLTDYLPNLIIPVFWIYALLAIRDKKWWISFITAHLPLLMVFLLWLPYLQSQLSLGLAVREELPNWWSVLGSLDIKELLLVPVKFILGRITLQNKLIYTAVAGLLGVLYAISIIRSLLGGNNIKNGLKLVWLWLTIPILLALLVGTKISVFSYFRLIFVLPAFYILTAVGISKLKTILKLPIFLILFWANLATSAMYLANKDFWREDWRGLFGFIKNNSADSSTVLFPSSTGTEALRYYAPVRQYSVKKLPSGYNEVWLMRYAQPIFDSGDLTRMVVEDSGFEKMQELDFNGVVVWRYISNF